MKDLGDMDVEEGLLQRVELHRGLAELCDVRAGEERGGLAQGPQPVEGVRNSMLNPLLCLSPLLAGRLQGQHRFSLLESFAPARESPLALHPKALCTARSRPRTCIDTCSCASLGKMGPNLLPSTERKGRTLTCAASTAARWGAGRSCREWLRMASEKAVAVGRPWCPASTSVTPFCAALRIFGR